MSSHPFDEYIPRALVEELVDNFSRDVPGVPGLRIVVDEDASEVSRFPELYSTDSLQFMVDVYRDTLSFDHTLVDLLRHRKMKRNSINEAAASSISSGKEFRNVLLPDGTITLGYREDTRHIRDDADWRVADIPRSFKRFHDTITGPPLPNFISNALKSGVHFFMVDFEDSSTVSQESLLVGMDSITRANKRSLDWTSSSGKRYTVLPQDDDGQLAEMLVRFEGLHLPNGHFIVDGIPIPAHVATISMYLYHNWAALRDARRTPAFYIPKLESYEEACYVANLFAAAENRLSRIVGPSNYAPGSITCFVIIENVFAVYQKEEILYALRDHIAGLNCGWHDYMASIGAVHQALPTFNMPPKSNLRIVVDHLQAYQVGIVEVCGRRGAIPIGGMNAMVPTRAGGAAAHAKIVKAFTEDFWAQVDRGLQGCWLAHTQLAPVVHTLVVEHQSRMDALTHTQRKQRQDRIKTWARTATHSAILVADLPRAPCSLSEFQRNVSDALQYLAAYVSGSGCVGLTRVLQGTPVRLMEDAATLERSRREIWAYQRYGRVVQGPNGDMVVDEALVRRTLAGVAQAVQHQGNSADVPYSTATKIPYDVAARIVLELLTSPNPVDYFTVLTTKHLLTPFRGHPGRLERVQARTLHPFVRMPNVAPMGRIAHVSNEQFAPATSLLKETFPSFQPHKFGPEGQVYDGWETARHNLFPPDQCIIVLRRPTRLHGCNIDTAHFHGNHAHGAALHALVRVRGLRRVRMEWRTLLEPTHLAGNARNYHALAHAHQEVQVVRLDSYPDGGIARLQLFGQEAEASPHHADRVEGVRALLGAVVPVLAGHHGVVRGDGDGQDLIARWVKRVAAHHAAVLPQGGFHPSYRPAGNTAADVAKPIGARGHRVPSALVAPPGMCDLAADSEVVAASSARYSVPGNMFLSGRAINMGEGWETARIRPPPQELFQLNGPVVSRHHWTVFKLSTAGHPRVVLVDTLHFKHNTPLAFTMEGAVAPNLTHANYHMPEHAQWRPLIPLTTLKPNDERHVPVANKLHGVTHILLKIYPCGGISRLRIYGHPAPSQATSSSL